MDLTLIANAFRLAFVLCIPIIGAVLAGALVAGIFRAVTQIDDSAISVAGKLAGLAVFLYLGSVYLSSEIVKFTEALWGRAEYFY